MDETQQSTKSDAAAAATRKRRSSILKSQRPPRTPFSELEFHVTTPTDTAKSRRVSFSKRTGVAEFATNEATTTWKNFYEEHNKSLESSGNDSGANPPKPTIGHLGKRIFDQQFEEVEAVDFMTSLENHSRIDSSMNRVNFTEQLASLECTDKSLLNPRPNLEMSSFTDCKSNVFGDDFALPTMGEASGRIDVNFSAIQPLGSNFKDDLDEIQEDLKRAHNNLVCPGPFNDRRDLSEYIEVELNSTHVVMRNDESDMSITDTILSPKVQELAKINSIIKDKKLVFEKDWVADKENIAVLGVLPSPEKPVNEKRKTIVCENDTGNISITQALPVDIILPGQSKNSEKRKTIVYDDDAADISVTQAVPLNIVIVNKENEKRKTIIYANDTGNISVTEAIPSNIILPDKNKTIISQDDLGNISITQAIPIVKIISSNISQLSNKSIGTEDRVSNVPFKNNDPHKTIIYGDESLDISGLDNNMSITRPIDTKCLVSGDFKEKDEYHMNEIKTEKKHNISTHTRQDIFVYQASTTYNEKVTNDEPSSNPSMKNLFNFGDNASTSLTAMESKESQLLKQDIYDHCDKTLSNKEPCTSSAIKNDYDEDNKENIFVEEPINKNTVSEKRKTILYDDDMGNLSITQAIPANIILPSESKASERRNTTVEEADVSVTQAVPLGVLLVNKDNKHKTIVLDNEDACDLSVTHAIPTNILQTNRNEGLEFEQEINDISFTQPILIAKVISTNSSEVKNENVIIEKQSSEVNMDRDDEDMTKNENENITKTDISNISLNKSKPITSYKESLRKSMISELLNMSNEVVNEINKSILAKSNNQDLFVYQAGVMNDELIAKNSSEKDDTQIEDNKDNSNADLSNNKSISFTGSSYAQLHRSIPVNQSRMLTLESESVKDNEDQKTDSNKTLSEGPKLTPKTSGTKEGNKSKQTILDNLLDMSALDTSIDKNAADAPKTNEIVTIDDEDKEYNDLIHSIKDSDGEMQTDAIEEDIVLKDNALLKQKATPLALELKEESKNNKSFDFLKKALKTKLSEIQKSLGKGRKSDKGRSSIIENEKPINKSAAEETFDSSKNFQEANDTNELLEMLSDMTDKTQVDEVETLKKTISIRSSQHHDANEPRRLSLVSDIMPDKTQADMLDNSQVSDEETPRKEVSRRTSQHIEASEPRRLSMFTDVSDSQVDREAASRDLIQRESASEPRRLSKVFDKTGEQKLKETKSREASPHKKAEELSILSDVTHEEILKESVNRRASQRKEVGEPIRLSILSDKTDREIIKEPVNKRASQQNEESIPTKLSMLTDMNDGQILKEVSKTSRHSEANESRRQSMISDMADKSFVGDPEIVKETVSGRTSQHIEANEHRRLSVAPSRLSIVLSREDLLNNISMAQAALQKSMEIDESMADTSITPTEPSSPPKQSRVSNEVVKKLKFEDESTTEMSAKSDVKLSPLKKSAREDRSPPLKDSKAKVIPSYLEVSDEIKSLMDDLVKPNADTMPFPVINKGQHLNKNPSTCSTQIQANLITSSQIDVHVEYSNSPSTSSYNLGELSNPSFFTDNKSLKSSLKSSKTDSAKPKKKEHFICPKLASPSNTLSDRVIVFDQNNPLNNVLLGPPDYTNTNVHRYQPRLDDVASVKSSDQGLEKTSSNDTNTSNLPHYDVGNVLISVSPVIGTNMLVPRVESQSSTSKATSIPELQRVTELKDTKVNTLIAMKQNKELLEASSSLTLVDDAVIGNNLNVDIGDKNGVSSGNVSNSLIKLIFQNEEHNGISRNKDYSTSADDTDPQITKAKKRNYSPFKRDQKVWSTPENTPKQISKIQKMSTSPYHREKGVEKLEAERDDDKMDIDNINKESPAKSKEKKASPRKPKRSTDITVHQLITDYDNEGIKDEEPLSKHIVKGLSPCGSFSIPDTISGTDIEFQSPEMVSSFTSSKNQMEMRNACSVTTTDTKSSARSSKMSDWLPEDKENKDCTIAECDSSVNVVAKIDMMPFMGSHECEWEQSGSDTWAFRLLHARLRLTVRLAHRHDNATRTRVRADTPVLAVALDVAHSDKKNPVATFCINFAADTMRHYVSRGCARAGDVPLLLRRCAGTARVALRWGRAMYEARLHLAYALQLDGRLTFKVANIPLRSVWEVAMRIELVTDGSGAVGAPWPRATDVSVARVVSDVSVRDHELKRLLDSLPQDWGHAPRAIWKIFRYLKNKTRDEELLGLI